MSSTMHCSARFLFASLGVALAALAPAAPAAASQVYPDHLVTKLQMPCAPGCQLCHLDASGGPFKINPKFGMAAKMAGAGGAAQTDKLDMALAALATSDVDGDGVKDVAELQAGSDPNVSGGDLCGGIKYGCGASTIARRPVEKSPEPGAIVAAATVLLGMLLVKRRRR
jgi:hypothetical protein